MSYDEDLKLIKQCLDFLIDNYIEGECVEYETETIHEVLERLLKVIKPYWEEECLNGD